MSILIRLLAAASIAVLGACATRAPSPAPVENRTRPPAGASAPVVPVPAPSPVPAPAAGASPDAPAVQTAPVRSSGVESRPLGRAQAPAVDAAGPLRREPKGLKRPFSEATLAELRAADAGAHAAPPPGATGSAGSASGGAGAGAVAGGASAAAAPGGASAGAAGAGSPGAGAAGAGAAGAGAAGAGAAGAGAAGAGAAGAAGSGTGAGAAAAGSATPGAAASGAPRPGAASPGTAASGPSSTGADGEFAWPARGKVVQGFSEPRHMGILISGAAGDPVTAAADGQVIFSGPGPRGYGNLLIVKHDAETLSVYAHNRALLVKERERVRRGQRIAELGDTGTDRPQLHFEIRKSGKPVDPMKLLPPR